MIPKPRGELGQTGKGKEGYNLRREMGMMDHKRLYNDVKVSFVYLCTVLGGSRET